MEDLLEIYSANSANDFLYKNLWYKGASLIIPQLNELLKLTDYNFNIINIEYFTKYKDYNIKDNIELNNIFKSNLTDKSTCHNYDIIYTYIFNKLGRYSELNVLEIGIGTNNNFLVSTMGQNGRPGASLYSFKEFLPNSNIYGADIDVDILFDCDRIKTCYVDQLDIDSFHNLKNKFGNLKYNLIIDDGLHSIGANLNTLLFAIDNLASNGWIIIEDISKIDNWRVVDYIINSTHKYNTYLVKTKLTYIYVLNKLT